MVDNIKPIIPLHGQIGMINLLTGPDEERRERDQGGLNFLPAVANCELDDARCHLPRRPSEPIEVFRRIKRCSLKVC